jgi:hypothetical protein
MKHPVTLFSIGRTEKQTIKQIRRWFKMNPNRWRVNVKLSPTETILINRGETDKIKS